MSEQYNARHERRVTRFFLAAVNRFYLVAFTGIIGVILLVSYKQGVFVPHTPLYFYAADAIGISKGMPVKLFGLPVGNVRNMEIADRGVKVELSIVSDYLPRIPKDSQARLARESYVGGASLQIIPGADPNQAAKPVVAGDEIEFVTSHSIAEIIDDIKNQVTPLINDLRGMLAEINQPESDYRKSTSAARTLLEQLPVTNQEARQTLRDIDRTVVAVGREAEATLGTAARIGAQTEQQLPVLAGKLATTLDSLNEAVTQVRDATRKNSDALHETLRQTPALVRDGGDLVRDGQEIVGAVRNAWPIRNLVEAPAMRTLPVDSFESARPLAPAQR